MPQRTTYWKPISKTRPDSRSRPVQGNLNWSFSGIVRQRPLQKRYRGFLEFLDILSQVLSVFRGILPHSSMLSRSKGGPRRPLPCPETWEKLRKALQLSAKPFQSLTEHFFSCRASSCDFWCSRRWWRSDWRSVWFRWGDRSFRSRSNLSERRRFGGCRWGRTPIGRRENQQSRRPAEVNWIHSFYSGKTCYPLFRKWRNWPCWSFTHIRPPAILEADHNLLLVHTVEFYLFFTEKNYIFRHLTCCKF